MTKQGDRHPGKLEQVRVIESVKTDGFLIEAAFLEFPDRHERTCRVYAERCLVGRKGAPALVHCPGGGQAVNRADLLDWARHGFCVVSFDWQIGDYADHDPKRKSRWPEGVVGQNHYIRHEREAILPLAIQAAGACIDWMLDSGCVCPYSIGVTGISWGGYLTWLIAAYEPRVKAAVPVYGCGGHFDERHPGSIRLNPGISAIWRDNWDPYSIPHRQSKPVCYLSCTNDFFGIAPLASELLDKIAVPKRRGWLPNGNHCIGPGESNLGRAWLTHYLNDGPPLPAEPVLDKSFSVMPDQPEQVVSTETWWTPELRDGNLGCWIEGKPDRPFAAVYGRVHYKSGITLSTPIQSQSQSRPRPRSRSRSTLPYGLGWHWEMGSTQIYGNRVTLEPVNQNVLRLTADPEVPGDARSFFLNQFADPGWNTGDQKEVRIGLRSAPPAALTEVTATLFLRGTGNIEELSATIPVEKDTITIRWDTFPGRPPIHTWKSVVRVIIRMTSMADSFLIGPIEKA